MAGRATSSTADISGFIPSAVSLVTGDMLNPYLEAAREYMSESDILDIIRSCGLDWRGDLSGFRKLLRSELHFPVILFSGICSGLLKAGMAQERAMYYSHTRRISLRSVTKMNLVLMNELAEQEFGRELLDIITISVLHAGVYDPVFCNSICTDGALEQKNGNRRLVRYICSLLHPDVASWFWINHARCLTVYAPTNMGEPKAECKIILGDDFVFHDPQVPDQPLRLPAKPSLRQVAKEHGFEFSSDEEMVYFGPDAVAVRDRCPGRVMDGMYRMIRDVRLEKGQALIEKPDSIIRPYHSRLLYKSHRYHVDRPLPLYEIEMNFTIHSLRQIAFSGSLVASRKLWSFFTRSKVNPWRGLLRLTESRNASPAERAIDEYFLGTCQPAKQALGDMNFDQKLIYYKSEFSLTSREAEVLGLIIEGKTNQEIAMQLDISTLTVKSHVSHILSKTGLPSRKKIIATFTIG